MMVVQKMTVAKIFLKMFLEKFNLVKTKPSKTDEFLC